MDILQQTSAIGSSIASLLLGFTAIILLWWFSSRNHDYWKKRGVRFIPPHPFVGSLLENLSKPLHEVELERYKKYGRIYGVFEANKPTLIVADPKHLRNILVKDFPTFTGRRRLKTGDKIRDSILVTLHGEDWKRVRTIVTPTFTTGKIKRLLGIFKDCSNTLVKNYRTVAEKNEPVDVKRIYGAFTMDVIASSAFSTKIDSHNDPNNKFVATAREAFTRLNRWRLIVLNFLPKSLLFLRNILVSTKGFTFFKNVTLQIVEERRKAGQTRNDFLQLLMDTAKEVSKDGTLDHDEKENDIVENYGKDENDVVFKNVVSKKSLSMDELVAQCIVFFLAGYETTASTLSFVTYSLALNPDVQERLIQEIDDALKENNGEFTYEAIQGMKYLDNVISETLRMFPPAVRIERVADEDYKLGDTGIIIPKGMVVGIPVIAIHRDPEFYPDPEKFDPDRFTPEQRAKRDQYAYLPFGAGPRNCVGMRFALMEAKVCLAYVLSNFRFKTCRETKVPLKYRYSQGLLQPTDITIQIEVRQDAVKVP